MFTTLVAGIYTCTCNNVETLSISKESQMIMITMILLAFINSSITMASSRQSLHLVSFGDLTVLTGPTKIAGTNES